MSNRQLRNVKIGLQTFAANL